MTIAVMKARPITELSPCPFLADGDLKAPANWVGEHRSFYNIARQHGLGDPNELTRTTLKPWFGQSTRSDLFAGTCGKRGLSFIPCPVFLV